MRAWLVAILLCVTAIFQHFQLFQVDTYRVTIGLFTGCLVVLLASRQLSFRRLAIVWGAAILLAGLAALFAPEVADAREFLTTLALVLLTSLIVVAATRGIRAELYQSRIVWLGVYVALVIVVTVSVAQTLTGLMGIGILFNPFGQFQFQNEYNPHLEFDTIPRAQGFYLEPSYDAFVIGTLSVALLCSGRYVRSTIVLALAGLAACQSATGFILLLVIAVLIAVRSRPRIAVPIFAGVLLLSAAWGAYLISRIASIGSEGSSANYRLVAPLKVLGDVLTTHPFGLPLGSIYRVLEKYDLFQNGVGQTVSLDNGVYVVIYYFGWIGIALLVGAATWALVPLFRERPLGPVRLRRIAPIWLFGSLLFSGGIVAPEFGIMTWLVVSAFTNARDHERRRLAERATT